MKSGDLEVVVTDGGDRALPGAVVTIEEVATGRRSVIKHNLNGTHSAVLLAEGLYVVTAENIGFVPVLVPSIFISGGSATHLELVLRPAVAPFTRVDTTFVASSRAGLSTAGTLSASSVGRSRLPGDSASVTESRRLVSGAVVGDATYIGAGFPEFWLDGLPVTSVRHPRLPQGRTLQAAFSPGLLTTVVNQQHPFDVEWSGGNGSFWTGATRGGSRQLGMRGSFDWAGSSLINSNKTDFGGRSVNEFRGDLTISGPIVRDTSNFAIGAAVRNIERPVPAPFGVGNDGFVTAAQGALGADLSAYNAPLIESTEVISAFGRFDWQFSSTDNVVATVAVSDYKASNLRMGARDPNVLGSNVEGTDFLGQFHYQSRIGGSSFQELRIGFNRTERGFSNTSPLTSASLSFLGVGVGSHPLSTGDFQSTEFRLRETLYFSSGDHRVKFGVEGGVTTYKQGFVFGGSGHFVFGDEASALGGTGSFFQAVGAGGVADFTTGQVGVFLQDVWTIVPGLDLKFGLRGDAEIKPTGQIRANAEWFRATELANSPLDIDETEFNFGPRLGLEWLLGADRSWKLVAQVSRFHSRPLPGQWAELLTLDGRIEARRGLGAVGAWPGVPDSLVAPVAGPILTLAGSMDSPSTTRSLLAITRTVGNTEFAIAGSYRHTDRMIRRSDLNRVPGPVASDQDGRPLYGTLEQHGGLVAPTPGANRRFPEFDLVSALNQDGFVDLWDVSLGFSHEARNGFLLRAQYSFTRTRDNLVQRGFGSPFDELSPFPDSLGGADWMDGKSDLDVPHRVVVSGVLPFPGVPSVKLSGVYSFSSGLPFTPGFQPGVDINGDGSGGNDPAFIDSNLISNATLNSWQCLRNNIGRIAERNTCRAPGNHRVDLGLSIELFPVGTSKAALFIEGLNLTDNDPYVVDRALYLVDPAGTLQVDATTNTVNVPLIANPGFGTPLVRRASGRSFRFGIRI